ncbi:SNF2 family N-terminal domain-domain-containing protein [Aspergillus taichungensis]|uniref:SNF2 family N-terminal domain-domain-containing protein n=1 Tax=Aspergillus taichungensis TaxID=482145 RepID=A0A2J5HKL8_9EURO|nr:SNF2 family N-terminal domain-domain-containing protein [Aspergillus taichungensis]
MSNPDTPITPTESHGENLLRSESTQPSSPMTDAADREMTEPQDVEGMDVEGMDAQAKALMHLLNTSEVFVAIMADKMKKQQEEARLEAMKQQQRQQKAPTETKKKPEPAGKRETRTSARQSQANGSSAAETTTKATKQEANGSKGAGRGRKAAAGKNGSISSYFQKAEVSAAVAEEKPSVQEALEHAADEYESNPTVLGGQDLVATQQPELVTGGKMRKYQLEGLEWLKSLWMNGLCGILADEMGLGKTVQVISLIAFLKEKNVSGPFLVAAPLSTVSNWVDEFARWTPGIKTVLYHGSKDERAAIRRKEMGLKNQRSADFPVVCTSYEICMNDRKFLSQYQWRYIVVDEGHRLKNMNCKLVKELLTYNSANRLLITGTPLQNNITELWSLLHFLLPEIFNDLDSFSSWFDFSSMLDKNGQADTIERRKRSLVSTMHSILKPFLLRRVKTDVETSLPKKREYIIYAPLTPEQKDLYREILSGTGRQYLENKAAERILANNERLSRSTSRKRNAADSRCSTPNKSLKSSGVSTPVSVASSTRRRRGPQSYKDLSDREFNAKLRKLEQGIEETEDADVQWPDESEQEEIERANTIKLAKKEISQKKMQNPVLQARLACNSPHNFYWPWGDDASAIDNTLVTASGKMLLLDRLVPFLLARKHKILIFSQFKTQLDILQDWATQLRSWNCCRIDGAISQSDRQAQIKAFNTNPTYQLFLLSTRAGGQGINLVAADTVILFDSDWNPQQDLQAQDRAHRIGQTKPVIVYRLATKGTVEQTLLEKADSKRRLERLVIQKGKFKSLLESGSSSAISQNDVDELRHALGEHDFERFETGADPASLLSGEDLEILTDRSEEAYARAEKGLDQDGRAFMAVETKPGGDGLSQIVGE